jgi:hypothetical protein
MTAPLRLGDTAVIPGEATPTDSPPAAHRSDETPTSQVSNVWHAALPRLLVTEHHLIGASLLRIGLGGVVLVQLLRHWWERDFLWGPNGVYPLWLFERDLPSSRAPSFFATASEPLFHALYVIAIIAALLYLIGWQTRWVGIWLYALTWSLVYRNPMLITGGEKLVLANLPYVILLLNTSAYLSVDSGWRRIGAATLPPRPFQALLHNAGLLCVFSQLAIMYGFAGFSKLLGEPWRDGTAVYYVLRAPEFTMPGLAPLIYQSAILVPLLTYLTLAFETSVPFLIWSRWTRWIVVVQAVVFHIFIGIVLGLVFFAIQALIFQFLLVGDAGYRSLAARIGRLGDALQSARPAALRHTRPVSR